MKRRHFTGLLGGAAIAWPIESLAQKAPVRIGLLASGAATSPASALGVDAINKGLLENGLILGRDYVLESRFAAGNYTRFPEMARELAQAGVSLILASTIAAVRAAQRLVPPVPVVMIAINDPVGTGLISSLARPGGHTTGLATLNEDLTSKLLDYQRLVLPKATVIAALFNPANPTNPAFLDRLRVRAGGVGMTVLPFELQSPDVLDAAFTALAAKRPDVLQVIADSGTLDLSDRIAALALAHRLPSFATSQIFAELGGLMTYGASRRQLSNKSGDYVRKILQGANPGDLPVEQPTRIELLINLKTAKALGLTIPLTLLAGADEVIE